MTIIPQNAERALKAVEYITTLYAIESIIHLVVLILKFLEARSC